MNYKNKIITPCISLSLSLALGVALSPPLLADTRGVVRAKDGRELLRYGKSYALLIGVSDYQRRSGWKDLDTVSKELDQVEKALEAVGFQKIVRVDNPDEDALRKAFDKFKDDYGFHKDNRLLFFFSGHGHTDQDGAGYLVPSDAPHPRKNQTNFLRKALPMVDILALARKIKARHALFLFDSCFSGSVFREKGTLPDEPPHITKLTARPVRQFITAGSAGETVPAKSTFTPAFADAIRYGKGDLDGDGYVTGMELGVHLEAEVSRYVDQTPQFGKIDEYELAQGDFVFVLDDKRAQEPKPVLRMAGVERSKPLDNTAGNLSPAVDPAELRFWDSVEESKDSEMYQAYLDTYPKGRFVRLARIMVKKLESQSANPSLQIGSESSVGWAKRSVPINQSKTGSQIASVMGTAQGAFAHPTELIVRSNVSGDTVYLDGKAMGPTGAAPHILSPGEHTIRVEKQGFEPFETKITLTAGTKKTIRARLMPVTTVGWAKAPSAVPINQSKTGPQAGARTGA